jgi:cytochrome b pre-mRNA-processing protein 3
MNVSYTLQTQQLPRKTALFWAAQCHRTLASQAAKPADTNLDGMSTANLQREIRNNMKTAPMQGLAAKVRDKVREKAPLLTETYAAYGATQKLFKECAGPGDYQIPQALENGGEIPTDESGVHLGVGTGWWYESTTLCPNWNEHDTDISKV